MAKTTQINTIQDGPRNISVQATVQESATTADVSDEVVIDLSALDPSPQHVVLERVWASTNGGGGFLDFDRNTDQNALTIPADSDLNYDFMNKGSGGWIDTGRGQSGTGDVRLSTNNIDSAGDSLSLHIEARKKFG